MKAIYDFLANYDISNYNPQKDRYVSNMEVAISRLPMFAKLIVNMYENYEYLVSIDNTHSIVIDDPLVKGCKCCSIK